MKPPQEINIKTLYLCIHKKFYDRSYNQGNIIDKKELQDILGRVYHLPKKLWPVILKEMEEMEMIEDLGSRRNNNAEIFDDVELIDDEYIKKKMKKMKKFRPVTFLEPDLMFCFSINGKKLELVKVNPLIIDPEEQANVIYQRMGIF